MTLADALLLLAAGFAAGAMNGAAGGGSLISFPALLAVGYSPVAANVTSTVGIATGYLGGIAGYRKELTGQRSRVRSLLPVSVLGAVTGAVILLVAPEGSFDAVVPWLILLACAMFAAQPTLARRVAARREAVRHAVQSDTARLPTPSLLAEPPTSDRIPIGVQVGTFFGAAYGAYFGAGLGVVLLAILGIGIDDELIRLNGLRGVLALIVNVVAILTFVFLAPVAWGAAALLAVSSLAGGWIGARGARRLPTPVLRGVIITFGIVAATRLLLA